MKPEKYSINRSKHSSRFLLQLLDVDPQDQAEEDGANVDLDSQRKGKCAVIKTSTRQVGGQIPLIPWEKRQGCGIF